MVLFFPQKIATEHFSNISYEKWMAGSGWLREDHTSGELSSSLLSARRSQQLTPYTLYLPR